MNKQVDHKVAENQETYRTQEYDLWPNDADLITWLTLPFPFFGLVVLSCLWTHVRKHFGCN